MWSACRPRSISMERRMLRAVRLASITRARTLRMSCRALPRPAVARLDPVISSSFMVVRSGQRHGEFGALARGGLQADAAGAALAAVGDGDGFAEGRAQAGRAVH